MILSPLPKLQFFDDNGDPLSGGKLYSYVAATTTPLATYSNAAGAANTNPVVLDAAGRADVWLDSANSYKLVLKTSAGATVWTVDTITTAGSVGTASITDGSVTEPKMAANSVSASALKSSASVDADRAVGTDHVKASAITAPKIATGAFDGTSIENTGSVIQVKAGGISQAKLAARAANNFSPLTATITIASPAVITTATHSLSVGDPVILTTTGALPTGLSPATVYYVSAVPSSTTFRMSATSGGSDINTSGSQSGTHTAARVTLAGGVAISSSSGTAAVTSATLADVTNLSVVLTTTGRPVRVVLMSDGGASDGANIAPKGIFGSAGNANIDLGILRDSTQIFGTSFNAAAGTGGTYLPASAIEILDTPVAGVYTYKLQARKVVGSAQEVYYCKLVAYEI